ncbi:cytochrome c oxidase subunit II [Georgenia sp. MJ278]
MRSPSSSTRRTPRLLLLTAGVAFLLAGCSAETVQNGFLPSEPGVTNMTGTIIDHWNGAWVAALIVGVLVWGLTIWCVVAYRKRKDDNTLPVQLRYHVPLELMYTVIPILMVGVLFFYSSRVTGEIVDTNDEADVHIQVYGKQWSWDFNYLDDGVYFAGDRVRLTGETGVEETLPTLYLPVGESVEITVDTRDVIHSFWIPAFLFKIDAMAGYSNTFQVTPEREGTFQGKCAELCGEFHAEMLFNVEVVDRETYDAHMDDLRDAGNVGVLGEELDRVYHINEREGGNV